MAIAAHTLRPMFVVDYNPKDPGIFHRHVSWLTRDRHPVAAVGVKTLAALEATLSAVTVVGLKWVGKAVKLAHALDAQNLFFEYASTAVPPARDECSEVKTPTRTFNHVTEFAVQDGIIWCRKRRSFAPWVPIYFDGWTEGLRPHWIDSDGANLIVIDHEYMMHYKKVLTEYRREELNFKTNRHFADVVPPDDVHYFAADKAAKINWKDEWFSLPAVHHFVNLIKGKRLRLAPDVKGVAISHRGRYNNYVEDRVGQHHPVSTGVTTLYILDANGRDIHKFDPWSPTWSTTDLYLPETARHIFHAARITTGASTIMAIGHQIERATGNMQLQVLTRLADIDTEGWNPGLRYAYFPDTGNRDVRVLPIEEQWLEHPLELKGAAQVSHKIALLQTGEGNDARELRVEGCDENGGWGFYWKNIREEVWHFDAAPGMTADGKVPLAEPVVTDLSTTVHNYQGSMTNGRDTYPVVIEDFGDRSYHSIYQVTINGTPYRLKLHKRIGLLTFLGKESHNYELVIPEGLHENPDILRVFGDRRVYKMNIAAKSRRRIQIRGPY